MKSSSSGGSKTEIPKNSYQSVWRGEKKTHHYHQYQQWRVVVAVDERQVEKEEIPKKVSKVFEERTRMQDLWYEQWQQGVVKEER